MTRLTTQKTDGRVHMTPTTDADAREMLEGLDAQREAATPGPWINEQTDSYNWIGPAKQNPVFRQKVDDVIVGLERGRLFRPEVSERNDGNAAYIASIHALHDLANYLARRLAEEKAREGG